MTPYYSDDHLTLYGGDCREVLAQLPAESVHTVVTSPPYWGLRDYGVGGQLGLEPTPEAYVENMVAVFREVRRVLRADGTLWLNLGDSYAGSGPSGAAYQSETTRRRADGNGTDGVFRVSKRLAERGLTYAEKKPVPPPGLKPKDLVGIPWRVAFALQADGWYLRSDIIWAKPNPMPESVTDRPTKAHEYLFLLSKAPRYYYDADAVREALNPDTLRPSKYGPRGDIKGMAAGQRHVHPGQPSERQNMGDTLNPAGRNLRSVWTIATEPYPGAHFATFPRKLVEPCVKAGTSERGVCPECGAPWVRVVERESSGTPRKATEAWNSGTGLRPHSGTRGTPTVDTIGWRASCDHDAEAVPASVLDPFAGSGTTLLVAQALGRRGIGIDLNPDYLQQALARNAQAPLGLVG